MLGCVQAGLLGGSVRGSLTPADFDPVMWFDFTDITTLFTDIAGTTVVTTNGDLIRRINNKGSDAINAIVAGPSTPTYSTTGIKPAGVFNGSGALRVTAAGYPTGFTATGGASHFTWSVGKLTSNVNASRNLIANSNNSFGFNIGLSSGGPTSMRSGLGSGSAFADTNTTITTIYNGDHILSVSFDASTDDQKRYRNGVLVETKTDYWTGNTGFNANDRLCIAAQASNSTQANYWIGSIYECGMLINPTAEAITAIHDYLKARYSIS